MSSKQITKFNQKAILLGLAVTATIVFCVIALSADCAPSNSSNNKNTNNNNNNNNNNQKSRLGIFSSLFRRGSGNESASSSNTNSQSSNDEEQMTEPEKEAQKFLDNLPGANQNKEPSTFRERIGDTFGLLREGVSNQFKSWRENWTDTVDDLRDTWSNE